MALVEEECKSRNPRCPWSCTSARLLAGNCAEAATIRWPWSASAVWPIHFCCLHFGGPFVYGDAQSSSAAKDRNASVNNMKNQNSSVIHAWKPNKALCFENSLFNQLQQWNILKRLCLTSLCWLDKAVTVQYWPWVRFFSSKIPNLRPKCLNATRFLPVLSFFLLTA